MDLIPNCIKTLDHVIIAKTENNVIIRLVDSISIEINGLDIYSHTDNLTSLSGEELFIFHVILRPSHQFGNVLEIAII